MKKNCFALLFGVLLSITMSGQKRIVATASMISDIAKQIAGDKCIVECIVPIGGDPHIYEPTPIAAKLAADADLILVNGLTFEGWLAELIENSGTSANIILVTENVDAIKSLVYDNASDPHAWMDAENGIIYAENIRKALSALDSENEAYYQQNFENYKSELLALDKYILEEINKIPNEHKVLITSHDAFQYYGKKYGLQLESILGTSTDAQEQTSDIIRVSKVISENKIPAVFIESTVNPKLLEQIARDNKIKIGGELFADSIGEEDSPANSYINMLRYNTQTIVSGLTSSSDDNITDMPLHDAENESSRFMYFIIALILVGGFWFMVYKLRS